MKSRKRCAAVALWLTLPIAVSTQLTTAFTSEAVLGRCGVVTAALNIPGFLAAYLLGWRMQLPALTLIGTGDVVFYVPLLYGLLRWSQGRHGPKVWKAACGVAAGDGGSQEGGVERPLLQGE